MIPILKWELRRRRTALIWWTIGTAGLVLILMAIYPSIQHQAAQFNRAINQLPEGIRQLKNGNSTLDVSSPIGYLNAQVFYITLPLLYIILAVTRGSALLGRDEQDHTLELLLARPVSRATVLLGKGLSLLCEVLLVTVATIIVLMALGPTFKLSVGLDHLLVTSLYASVFSLSFGAIAFALTAAGRFTKRSSTAIAVFIGFGGYLMTSLSGLTHYLIAPARFAPYHYYVPEKILQGHLSTGLNLYLIGIFIACALASYIGFRHRDIS